MKTIACFVLACLACNLIAANAATADRLQIEGKRGVTAEDYYSFKSVSDPRISPDGKLVAFVLTTVDQKQNRRHSSIWTVRADGSQPAWQFTTGSDSASFPRWSPDGSQLGFLSSRPQPGAAASEAATRSSSTGWSGITPRT